MKTKETNNTVFKGILSNRESVMRSFQNAGVKARILWQFGEPVEVEEREDETESESEDEADLSLPLLNATGNNREFFWL